MGKGFLNKLLGRSTEPPAHLAGPLADLARLAQERPALAAPAAVLSEVLPVLFAEPVRDSSPVLVPEQASDKLAGGLPLLRGQPGVLDEKGFRHRWQEVCAAVGKQHGGATDALVKAVTTGALHPQELLESVLAGRPESIPVRAEAHGLDVGLMATVLRLTLFPVVTRWAEALAPLREGMNWERGFCPTCGSWPLLAEFRGLEQVRFLRCGLCASGWEFPRLACPFCGCRDHRQLGYLHAEGEEASRRAATCDACRGYVKTTATLALLTAPGLLVADVATLHLDLAAAERGYFVG
ncbi:MAG: formate dehydrogenase accessory protein FdhE [Gemmataceae bacterium]|nr:formate dehydrogenase accessory protein FdhE [Gemmataceae bacterium]